MLNFPNSVMRQVDHLQINGGSDVGRDVSDLIMTEIELADVDGRQQMGYLSDFYVLTSIYGLILQEVTHLFKYLNINALTSININKMIKIH